MTTLASRTRPRPHRRDPFLGDVDVDPMLSERQADRALEMVSGAVELGAHVVEGGTVGGVLLRPTVVTDVAPGCRCTTRR
ncbi:aldehyde dehydrogenase family protein [Mycobacterium sp. URHB0021]|jgi:benzaldehyde dehydrogenase (NAD)